VTFGSVFAGIGGFDLGFERAGLRCRWQIENDTFCNRVLAKRWPGVTRYGDVREVDGRELKPVDVLCGGDPCPKHSHARSNSPAIHPDLAGYFLALVGRRRPAWVVRENVPAPTVAHFDAALAALGYGTVVIRLDAAEVTGQSRHRDFACGCLDRSCDMVREVFADAEDGTEPYATHLGTREVVACLTTHCTRYDSRDNYIWEPRVQRLRILDSHEREALTGLPRGWTAGLSAATRARMCGNAVAVPVAEWIGRRLTCATPAA